MVSVNAMWRKIVEKKIREGNKWGKDGGVSVLSLCGEKKGERKSRWEEKLIFSMREEIEIGNKGGKGGEREEEVQGSAGGR